MIRGTILFLFAYWLPVAWLLGMAWTWVDSRRRLGRTVGRLAMALLGVVPILGPLVYTFLRPSETLRRRRERERMRLTMERMAARTARTIPVTGELAASAPTERASRPPRRSHTVQPPADTRAPRRPHPASEPATP